MSKVLFVDSDVILDVLEKRERFYEYSAQILSLGDEKKAKLVTTSLAFANIYYLLRKHLGIEKAKESLRKLRIIVDVISVNAKEVDLALNSELSDFEDALQYFTALDGKIEFIITRNVCDYKNPKLIVQTPQQYIEGLNNKK
ncbi:PIN domain-containing protein [Treponema sp. Marseille-Q4130]|uniref:type II toxin-antitoxin system VapC family toxin n=1 Tax=Treponema sp. Marseille-Q4130 TaxID=2766702 RepID=UPI00165216B5|nr:PIN domain-containing protein [Treponema sp. Marseille-Q4130]MBC6719045.1 PIN domain-containing protein [Treponema sp. Marseille-Q4130]